MCRRHAVDTFVDGSGRWDGVGVEIVENSLRIDFCGRVCKLVGTFGKKQLVTDLTVAEAADGKAVDGEESSSVSKTKCDGEVSCNLFWGFGARKFKCLIPGGFYALSRCSLRQRFVIEAWFAADNKIGIASHEWNQLSCEPTMPRHSLWKSEFYFDIFAAQESMLFEGYFYYSGIAAFAGVTAVDFLELP